MDGCGNLGADPKPPCDASNALRDSVASPDDVRLGEPRQTTDPNEATPAALTHVVVRRVLMRSKQRPLVEFDNAVETEELEGLPESRREQMLAMLSRERAMLARLGAYNELAEFVRYRLPGESKV